MPVPDTVGKLRVLTGILGAACALVLVCSSTTFADVRRLRVQGSSAVLADKSRTLRATVNSSRANIGFIIMKPHAVTDSAVHLVSERLLAAKVAIVRQGYTAAEKIDDDNLLDKYYPGLSSKAMDLDPSTAYIPSAAGLTLFLNKFSVAWQTAAVSGNFVNAKAAMTRLSLTPEALNAAWMALPADKKVKVGSDFWVGKFNTLYVVNPFYPDLRKSVTVPGSKAYYFEVKFKPYHLTYADFNTYLIGGSSDPSLSDPSSLRYEMYDYWVQLGFAAQPDVKNNCIIASKSPFAGWIDPVHWLGIPETSIFLDAMAARGVVVGACGAADGRDIEFNSTTRSLYDHLAGLDRKECLTKLRLMFA